MLEVVGRANLSCKNYFFSVLNEFMLQSFVDARDRTRRPPGVPGTVRVIPFS